MGMFAESLESLVELGPECTKRFSASIDEEWIGEALLSSGKASVRRRKIPAEQAVWLVLGMGLFADRSIAEVVDHLDLVIPGTKSLAPSAIPKARYRLGPVPLFHLFLTTAEHWHASVRGDGYHGLTLFAVDGTCMRVQDSDENFEHFGKPGGRGGSNDAGYPQLRLACLMALSERLLVDASFGPYTTSEQELATELWGRLPPKSLTILDRGFVGYSVLASLIERGEDRHVMVRLRKDMKVEQLEVLSDGSALARLRPSTNVKRQNPEVQDEIIGRLISYQHPGGEPCRLFTTLVDEKLFPASELIALYHERWEIEIGYDELKTHMLERKECLRSKKPEGVEQELWGLLLVYNLVRFELAQAALEQDLVPSRMSFRHALVWMRTLWEVTTWRSKPGTMPKKLSELRSRCNLLVIPKRRVERRYPRHVKIKMSNFSRNRGSRNTAATAAK